MLGTGKILSSQFGLADCQLLPCPGWDCGALFPSATLRVDGSWVAGDATQAPVLLIAHLLAGGPCFFIRCHNSRGQHLPRPWTELHSFLAAENRAGVLKTGGHMPAEVMLVPLHAHGGEAPTAEPIFAGFVASPAGGDFVCQLLANARLPLVFDLDETLLVAKSQSQMGKELRALRDVRRPALQRATSDPQQAAKLAALDREEQLMQEDLALLQQFAERDAINYKGQTLVAQTEQAFADDMSAIHRPVIRLPDNGDTLFTRIEPANPHSSMVFKLRPNWRAIWSYLGGLMDPLTHQPITYAPPSAKLRFEAYVCTAAERGYALEAWRVLDPDGWMIPQDQRRHRLQAGAKLKSLAGVLRLAPPQPGAGGTLLSPMPLAAIVDDRVEIWDAASQGQVLQVEPFRPWEEAAAQELGLAGAPTTQSLGAQMIRLKDELFNLRLHAFHRVQEVLRPQLDLLRRQPLPLAVPLHEGYAAAMAPPPWVQGLLAAGLHRQPKPEPLPAALQAAMNRPVDPRQARRAAAAAAAGAAGQPAQPAQQGNGGGGGGGAPLGLLQGQAGVELFATLQGLLGGAPAAPPPPPQQQQQQQPAGYGVPVDPRLHLRQQPPQPQRSTRQHPGAPAEAPADPRRRPVGVAAANTSTLSEALGLVKPAAAAAGGPRPRPPPMKRLVGLHGPPADQPQPQPPLAPPAAGAPPPFRPMHRAQAPSLQPQPAATAQQQQQQAGAAPDELQQRWMESFGGGGAAAAAAVGIGSGGPHPMHRAGPDPAAAAGAKRKAPSAPDGDARHKQPRAEASPPSPDAVSRLHEAAHRQHSRLQWRCTRQADGSWSVAAFVGSWPADFPPPGEAPAGAATASTQQLAMQAAAHDALLRLAPAADGPPHTRGGHAAPGAAPPPPPQQRRSPPGGGGVTSRTAIDTLVGHFPAGTNRVEWQEQAAAPDGSARCRLVINGGEFSALGTAAAGPRADKRARQHAALQVLQQAGYAVSFDGQQQQQGGGPHAPAPGRGRGGRGRDARSLDSRHARAAAAHHGVDRDAYAASLHDELR